MISLENVAVKYKEGGTVRLPDLEVRGGITIITGPNGSGKTTLLRLCAGLIPHFYAAEVSGKIRVLGVNPLRDPDLLVGRIGYLSQNPEEQIAFPTVEEEVAYPLLVLGLGGEEARIRVREVLERLGASYLWGRTTFQLSSGEAQKVELAAALATDSKIILLDEPLGFLDEESRKNLVSLLRDLGRDVTILIVEQELEYLRGIADNLVVFPGAPGSEPASEGPPREPAFSVQPGMIVLDDVWYRYPKSEEPILRSISLEAEGGGVTAILGPNGSGKTTLLRLMAGVFKPSSGRIRVKGRVFYVPQNPLLGLKGPTVEDEVYTNRGRGGIEPGEALEIMGLTRYRSVGIARLSHGLQRRLALASALASGASIVLMDEPTAGLDPLSRKRLSNAIKLLSEGGVRVVVASHDKRFVKSLGADSVVRLARPKE